MSPQTPKAAVYKRKVLNMPYRRKIHSLLEKPCLQSQKSSSPRQLPHKDFILEKQLKVDFASCRIFAQVFGLKQLAEIEELGRSTFDLEQLELLERFVSQGIIRTDTVQDAFTRVMRTLKQCMFEMGLKDSYRTMETEELYRGPPTVARLRVVLAKTQNTARALRDLKKTLLKVFKYEQMLPQLRAVLS
jgi:hypothetical protein